ncbi:hypothetical protein [Rummeliibacillus pycnus]|uniref:hypothetical protein n=1 Tax=Rummeliibacillus pycnus TaxID=101070 RepID=UPI003D27ED6E
MKKENELTFNAFRKVLVNEKFDTEYLVFRDDQGNMNNLIIHDNEFYTSTAKGHVKVSNNFAFRVIKHIRAKWYSVVQTGIFEQNYLLEVA